MEGYISGRQERRRCVVRLNANENPFPIPSCIQEVLKDISRCDLRLYPDERSSSVREVAARVYGLLPNQVIADNGSSALLSTIFRTVLDPGDSVAVVVPTFALYKTLASIQAAELKQVVMGDFGEFPVNELLDMNPKMIVIPNPNAPIGYSVSIDVLEGLVREFDGVVVVDEAYADFSETNALDLIRKYPNVIVTRTFSKAYSLAGLRFGLGFSSPEIIENLDKVRSTYNVNSITQLIAIAVLEHLDDFKENTNRIKVIRDRMAGELSSRGFGVFPSKTNFLFMDVPIETFSAAEWERRLREAGILVRCYPGEEGLENKLRISIGSEENMQILFRAIDEMLSGF